MLSSTAFLAADSMATARVSLSSSSPKVLSSVSITSAVYSSRICQMGTLREKRLGCVSEISK